MATRDRKITKINSLSKLGDPLVNFIYSLARTEYLDKPQGEKVTNHSLTIALKKSGLRNLAPRRADRHLLGDFVEAIIYYSWKNKTITIREASKIIAKNLNKDLDHRTKGKKTVGKAFSELLKHINKKTNLNQFYENDDKNEEKNTENTK